MFKLLRIISFSFLIAGTSGQLQCGFPGQPQNGNVNIAFDSSKAVAKYECSGSFVIDGDEERTCREDGTWTGTIPRCATEVPVKSLGNDNLADGKLETCEWMQNDKAVVLEFEKDLQMHSIKMIYPTPYKDSLKDAEFDVQVLNGSQSTGTGVDKTFHERDPTCSVQWRLNNSGNTVRVGLVKGSAYICEIQVLTSPEECGKVEEPRNGRIEYNKSSALCRCDTHYQVEGNSSVRMCSDGRWTGEQCACHIREIQMPDLGYIDIIIMTTLPIIAIIQMLTAYRSQIKRRLLDVKEKLQMLYQAPAKSSNVQLDELQKMNPLSA